MATSSGGLSERRQTTLAFILHDIAAIKLLFRFAGDRQHGVTRQAVCGAINMSTLPTNDPVDVLIIGAGASGAAIAWSLTETRMRILCLEQGDWMKSSEYTTTTINWVAQQFGAYNIDPNVRGLETDYPVNNKASPIDVLNFNGEIGRAHV